MIPPQGIKIPQNIMVRKFLPQQAILAHPNVKGKTQIANASRQMYNINF
jgi:hypothetical protein